MSIDKYFFCLYIDIYQLYIFVSGGRKGGVRKLGVKTFVLNNQGINKNNCTKGIRCDVCRILLEEINQNLASSGEPGCGGRGTKKNHRCPF